MMWGPVDFTLAGILVVGVGLSYGLAVRMTRNLAYRAAVGVALAGAFLLIWMNLAVGLIGSEDNAANLMYGGVLAVGTLGATTARFQPSGLARAMAATALAQMLVAAIVLIAELDRSGGPLETVTLNGFFAALWLLSAWLFQNASR